jgi:hypothetical protein
MARDLKLQFLYTDTTAGAGIQGVAKSTPSGEPTDTGVTINLYNGSAGTSVAGAITSATLNMAGFRNTKMDTSSFANFIAGKEVTATANDPALWGNTSYSPMVLHSNYNWVVPAAATAVLENGAFITVQGAFDNGSGSVDTTSWAPISGNAPLTLPVGALAAVAAGSGSLLTTTSAHGLVPGDGVVLYTTTGLTNATAKLIYRVGSVPSPTTFTVLDALGSALGSAITGTPSANHTLYKVLGFNGLGKIVNVPLLGTVRPYMRVVFSYSTANLVATSALQVTLSRTVLITGRESAVTA